MNFAATFALIGLVAWLAYGGGDDRAGRLLRLVGALGLGGLVWWLVSALPLNLLYDGRSDHTAWAFAFFGLFLLARGTAGSRRRWSAAALLLTAAFWAKQPTLVASLAAALWMGAAAALGRRGAARGPHLVRRAPRSQPRGARAAEPGDERLGALLRLRAGPEAPALRLLLAVGARAAPLRGCRRCCCSLALAAVLAWQRAAPSRASAGSAGTCAPALGGSPDARLASLLVLTVVIGVPAGVYFRLKVGSDVNQYIGVLWAAGLLIAIAYRRLRARITSTALAAAAAIALLFVSPSAPPTPSLGARVPPVWKTAELHGGARPSSLDYARDHLVYEQVQSDLNVEPQGSLYPNFYNFIDLLAAGRQPLYLVHALLDRRFDAVAPFRFAPGRRSRSSGRSTRRARAGASRTTSGS